MPPEGVNIITSVVACIDVKEISILVRYIVRSIIGTHPAFSKVTKLVGHCQKISIE